ncbi:MAG: NUDIX hydrolase [Pseudomonadales bacterium]
MSDLEPATGDAEAWLARVKRLRAIAQTGLAYSRDGYDRERFQEVALIAEQMLAAIADVPAARVRELYLPERGYPTPKVDVRAGVFRDDQVLLVRETSDGRWSLPGGWADEQTSPRQNVEREVLEEAGCRVRALQLVALKDRNLHPYQPRRLESVYKLLFLCELESDAGAATLDANLETTEAAFFARSRLPPLSPGRTLPADIDALAAALAAHRSGRPVPVYFD